MIILYCGIAPHPLAGELISLGMLVEEAMSISEGLNLAEHYPDAPILIAADVQPEPAKIIQQHFPTFSLGLSARASDVVWELSHLCGDAL